jgi:ribosomal protein S12 methylthiotransferase
MRWPVCWPLLAAVFIYSGSLVWLKRIGDDSPPLATTVGTLTVSLALVRAGLVVKSADRRLCFPGLPEGQSDAERILTKLRAEGYEISPSYDNSDLVIVNTCGFIDAAVEESLDAIGEALNENGKVIVTGCLGAKGDIVQTTHPAVLAVTGPHAADEVMGYRASAPAQAARPVFRSGAAAGHAPDAGPLRLPEDFRRLQPQLHLLHHPVAARPAGFAPGRRRAGRSRESGPGRRQGNSGHFAGHQRLRRRSQIPHRFWGGKPVKSRLKELCEALASFGIWVRLHYVYPYPSVDDVIPLMAEGKILPYLDVPFQHASPKILKAMKRPASAENTLERIRQVARNLPGNRHPLDLHHRLPRRNGRGFRSADPVPRRCQARPRRCFCLLAGRGRQGQRTRRLPPEDVREDRRRWLMQVQEDISRRQAGRQDRQRDRGAGR